MQKLYEKIRYVISKVPNNCVRPNKREINGNKGNTTVTFSFPYSITETKQVETGFRDLAMWCEITSFVFKKPSTIRHPVQSRNRMDYVRHGNKQGHVGHSP